MSRKGVNCYILPRPVGSQSVGRWWLCFQSFTHISRRQPFAPYDDQPNAVKAACCLIKTATVDIVLPVVFDRPVSRRSSCTALPVYSPLSGFCQRR